MSSLPPMPPARTIPLPCGGWLNVHEQEGKGPTLLLIHGLTDHAESFRLMLPHLAGLHLVIPDLRGHGHSVQGGISSLDGFAEDIEAVAASLDLRDVVLVGHSMGSLIATKIALRGKVRVSGLVTISGSLTPNGPALQSLLHQVADLPDPLASDHPFLSWWYACDRSVPKSFLDRLISCCVKMRREDWLACLDLLASADLGAAAARLRLPVLVLSGDRDEIFPPRHHQEMVAALQPASAIAFEGVGHNPHWELPKETAAALKHFGDAILHPTACLASQP